MVGSTLSLESLSSPSPSPPPQNDSKKNTEPTSAGLDSDSELSELTEEEQETSKRDSAPHKGARNGAYGRRRPPSRRTGRRKTSSIVPAPMWGWAETRSSNIVEEEEEEEIALPTAMEEEEEDEAGNDSGGDDPDIQKDHPPEAEEDDQRTANGVDEDDDDESVFDSTHFRRLAHGGSEIGSLKNAATHDDDAEDQPSGTEANTVPGDDPESEDENNENTSGSEDEQEKDMLHNDKGDKALDGTTVLRTDVSASKTQDAIPFAAIAAPSSIMAGSSLITPLSPSLSQQSVVASSRSASPAQDSDADEEAVENVESNKQDAEDNLSVKFTAEDTTGPEAVVEQEEEGDPDDANLDDDADMEVESDLQPAHRAEALDVLARIELDFALLRERVYVEKMDTLAWEESLINGGSHPELVHLQRELSNRRDKLLELASRKRSYELACVNKRRRTDDAATWSWWKLARDELQTEMISEANRKRRRMERERRQYERTLPPRRLPSLPEDLPPAPSFRSIIKSSSGFNTRNRSSKFGHRHGHRLVYPELMPLSNKDVVGDLDFIYQARAERERARGMGQMYDLHHVPRTVGTAIGMNPNGTGPHMGGIGVGTGGPPSIAPSRPTYDVYGEGGTIGGPRTYTNVDRRMHSQPPFQQHHHFPPPQPSQLQQPVIPHGHGHNTPFAPPPPGTRAIHLQGQPQQHPPPPMHTHTQHSHPPPPSHHSSQFTVADQHDVAPGMPPHHALPHSHNISQHSPFFPSRRSMSPPVGIGILPNGNSAPSGNMGNGSNGTPPSWMGAGMGMERVYPGSSPSVGPGKPGEWARERDRDTRPADEEERDRIIREKEKRDRDRDRDRVERERESDRDRGREREMLDIERERQQQRDVHRLHQPPPQQQQQAPHRHPPPPPPHHVHVHPAPPGSSQPPHHHINGPHHHHRPHHHHVLHHHHQPPPANVPGNHTATPPPPGTLHSSRGIQDRERERDFDSRPHASHNSHPTEVINLTSSKAIPSSGHTYHDQHPPADYRDVRSKHGPASGRTASSNTSMLIDDRERPLAMPFAIPPSAHTLGSSSHTSGSGSNPVNGTSSPRNSWNHPDDIGYRIQPSSSSGPSQGASGPVSYHGTLQEPSTTHTRSPSQNHRYADSSNGSLSRGPPPPSQSGPPSQQHSRQNSSGLHSPPRPTLTRPTGQLPSSPSAAPSTSSLPPYGNGGIPNANSSRSPMRHGPGSTPRSPPINHKMRPSTPPLSGKMSSGQPQQYSASTLSGPGRTSTPSSESLKNGVSGYAGSMGYPQSSRGYLGSTGPPERDRERDRIPSPHLGVPPPPPSTMSMPQMIDGH